MSKKALFWLFICIPLILIASGCVPCTEDDLDVFYTYPQEPVDGVIVDSLTPTFEWDFTNKCNPHEFRITLNKNIPDSGTVHNVSGNQRNFTISTPLEAGAKYIWDIYTTTATEYHGYTTPDRIFYTGPTCSNITPVAPVLDIPADGEFITPEYSSSPFEFHWNYPEYCLPSSYHYEFALDPNFVNILYSGDTPDYKQFVEKSFSDCTTVYWHVAAKNGNLMGPYSEIRSFSWIWDPNCWMNHYPSDDIAEISGRVYREMCDQTGVFVPSNMQLNPGCVKTNNYSVHADGVYTPNEHGLLEVVVDLGAGPCPSTGLDQDTTSGENGGFGFVVVTPGDYCLSVSRSQTGYDYTANAHFDLLKGMWTEPGSFSYYSLVAQQTISLGPGYHEVKQNFGWDEFDGIVKFFIQPTYCRIGPIPHCDPLRIYEIGEYAPMMARSADGKYIRTQFDGQVCYYRNFDEVPGDLPDGIAGMPEDVYEEMFTKMEEYPEPPPCPTPTPTPKPKSKPSGSVNCSQYSSEPACMAAGCTWKFTSVGPGYCSE